MKIDKVEVAVAAKPHKGLAVNLFDGVNRRQWVIVEYDDGTASIHGDWNEAIHAGEFDLSGELEATEREIAKLLEDETLHLSKDEIENWTSPASVDT